METRVSTEIKGQSFNFGVYPSLIVESQVSSLATYQVLYTTVCCPTRGMRVLFFSLFFSWSCTTRDTQCMFLHKQPHRLALRSTSSCDDVYNYQTLAYRLDCHASNCLFLSPLPCTHPPGPFPAATLRGTLRLTETPQCLGG